MLTEKDYCDYETCVALKELGFNDSTDLRYNYSQILGDFLGGVKAPTLYEAQKWLREEKKLFVEITLGAFDQTYLWEIYNTENSDLITGGFSSYDTYEEALSEGIMDAVEILKEKRIC